MDAGSLDWLWKGDGWMASERMETLLHLALSHETEEDGLGLWLGPKLFLQGPESAWGREHVTAQQVPSPSNRNVIPGTHMVEEESSQPWLLPSLAFSCPRHHS